MSDSFRRFEILLPRRFNDGEPVPDELIADTLLELEGRFGAVSSESQTIHGLWRQGEVEGKSRAQVRETFHARRGRIVA